MRRNGWSGFLALVLVMAVTPAESQDWAGTGRLKGKVETIEGVPLAGAEVLLRLADLPESGPPPIRTDESGRWAYLGLRPGRWLLQIQAEGFISADGWADIPQVGAAQPVEVQLRPLTEVTSIGSEGNPSVIGEWLRKGNALLEQDRPAEARAEYEKVLAATTLALKPQVHRAIARTWYEEGRNEKAIEAVSAGLEIAPYDTSSLRLAIVLLAHDGQSGEAIRYLARLKREDVPPIEDLLAAWDRLEAEHGLDPAPVELALPHGEEDGDPGDTSIVAEQTAVDPKILPTWAPDLPTLQAEAHRKGFFRVLFRQASPISSLETFLKRYKLERSDVLGSDSAPGTYDLLDESFEVYVPETYDPSQPIGLFVWVSPLPYGGPFREETRELMDRNSMIWIGANGSGNRRHTWVRLGLALDGAHNMQNLYNIDPDRIYVSGYSGGGRCASALAIVYSDVFRGGFFVAGCNFYEPLPVPDKPGAVWPARFRQPKRSVLKKLRKFSRLVFLTGDLDFNRLQTRKVSEAYVEDGFENVTLLEVPGMSHYGPVPPEWFDRGLKALDGEKVPAN